MSIYVVKDFSNEDLHRVNMRSLTHWKMVCVEVRVFTYHHLVKVLLRLSLSSQPVGSILHFLPVHPVHAFVWPGYL